MSEDLWRGCCLGYRIAHYLKAGGGGDLNDLIAALQQLRDGDLVLTDPSERAANSPEDLKETWQSIGHAANRSDREMAKRALEELANQKDD